MIFNFSDEQEIILNLKDFKMVYKAGCEEGPFLIMFHFWENDSLTLTYADKITRDHDYKGLQFAITNSEEGERDAIGKTK